MDKNEFLIAFSDAFDEVESTMFSIETKFKDFEEWGSVTVMAVMAMIRINYGVTLSGLDINKCNTIGEIYALVEEAVE